MKISETRNPSLTRAVVKALGGIDEARQSLKDVANHGADAGFCGFTYYSDTVAFYRKHRHQILARLEEDAEDCETPVEALVASFPVLCDYAESPMTSRELSRAIRQALCGVKDDAPMQVQVENALAWYALEAVAYEMTEG